MIRAEKGLSEHSIQRLRDFQSTIENVVEGVRRFSHNLRPGLLDESGLIVALRVLAEELQLPGESRCTLKTVGIERRLLPETEVMLFRIAQEALSNVRKHSQATEATIRVRFTKKKVKLCVSDNGVGFDSPEVLGNLVRTGKLGLVGMMERARLLNGSFWVSSRNDKGTKVEVEIPA